MNSWMKQMTKDKRRAALAVTIVVFLLILISLFSVAHELGHHHAGEACETCPVCEQIAAFKQVNKTIVLSLTIALSAFPFLARWRVPTVNFGDFIAQKTLVALNVKLSE